MEKTEKLLRLPIWDSASYPEDGSASEQIRVSYERARSVIQHAGMTTRDIVTLSPKFRAFYTDFLVTVDTAAATILGAHWNLCMGTIASYAEEHPDSCNSYTREVLKELQEFRSVGEFMLTEAAHGLDACHLETTATYSHDGVFDLHTPSPMAAKSPAPASPEAGVPRIAVVFAQLIVNGERRGVRPFIVRLCDADAMAPGVTSRLLPRLQGPKYVERSITMFDHVRLELPALLGALDAPTDLRGDFFRQSHRLTVGTLCSSTSAIPMLRVASFVLGRYSQRRHRRHGTDSELSARAPTMSLAAAQHSPVLVALTLSSILEAYTTATWEAFCREEHTQVREGLACIYKAAVTVDSQSILSEMIDRCGWQGFDAHNQMFELASAFRESSVAEGDYLVQCIRLVSELLLGRYGIPKARNPTSLLAKHEYGVWKEAACQAKAITATDGSNRSEQFNAMLLPRCRKLVRAIGHRMAYEAAVDSPKVTAEMLRLYEATCMLDDAAWYVENTKFTSSKLDEHHAKAVRALLPSLGKLLDESGAAPWITSPVLDEERWVHFVKKLPEYTSGGYSGNRTATSSSRVRVDDGVWSDENHGSLSSPVDGKSQHLEEYLDNFAGFQPSSNIAARNCNCL
ncbi:Acyl-CoA dehydrogenase/oxidase [Metarhizium rileyi]|uniref:Acyl-CoA dehydrogenase/oxidase n=1 Tax=Metarhizium rileyi (strain RCEF 4871) TaxID=1649241 RepID=A0A167JRL8_METRR|nr:Acyl-CoA dehydrogenase/oxidase [Metarhizium rileyi RCEF 4871]